MSSSRRRLALFGVVVVAVVSIAGAITVQRWREAQQRLLAQG